MLRSFVREESLRDRDRQHPANAHTCHSNVQNSEMTNQKHPLKRTKRNDPSKPKISANLSTLFLTSMWVFVFLISFLQKKGKVLFACYLFRISCTRRWKNRQKNHRQWFRLLFFLVDRLFLKGVEQPDAARLLASPVAQKMGVSVVAFIQISTFFRAD